MRINRLDLTRPLAALDSGGIGEDAINEAVTRFKRQWVTNTCLHEFYELHRLQGSRIRDLNQLIDSIRTYDKRHSDKHAWEYFGNREGIPAEKYIGNKDEVDYYFYVMAAERAAILRHRIHRDRVDMIALHRIFEDAQCKFSKAAS